MRTRKTKATRAPKRPVPTPQQVDEIRQDASAEMMLITDALRAAPAIPIYAMCMLDIEKVDLEAETIQVTYESGLGATSDRTEPINEPLARILRAAIGTRVSGPVFRRPDGSRFTRKRLCREWDRACRQAGFVPLQLRDSSLRFCVRGKTHPDNLTISELARKAKVRGPTAARWCELKAYPNGKKKGRKRRVLGHRSLGGFKGIDGGRGRYNYIRAEGWAIENGNIVPTYNRDQINKVLSSELNDDITPPEEEGFVWVNRTTAAHYEWTRDYLRHLANNVVESKRLRPQGQPLEPKRLAANKEQLDAHYQRIKDAEDRRKGHLLPSEFCSAINRPSSTVRSWIADDFCPDLNRPLNLRRDADGRPERQEVFREDGVPTVGRRAGELLFFVASLLGRATGAAEALVLLLIANRRKRFDSCYLIDEVEPLYVNAVNLVWIYGSTLTEEFGISATMLLWYARKGRIPGADIKLSHANCRMFPGSKRQPYVLRFHASAAIAYAEYRGRNDLAQKYREQLKQKLGTGKTACTAEQLEKRALAHWKPNGKQTSEQDQSADATLAGGTGESGQQEQRGNGAGLTMPAVASISRVDPLDYQELTFERAVIHVKHGELHLPAASTKALPQEQLTLTGPTPSDDFRSVNWHGKRHTFTPNQAACVEVLWQCWVGGTPVLGGMEILKRAGVSADRLVDVFRVRDGTRRVKHPAWGTMIVSPSKGAYRLAGEPPQK